MNEKRLNVGERFMVVCTKCGAKNEEEAKYCVKCGVNLETGAPSPRRRKHRREGECYGRKKSASEFQEAAQSWAWQSG